MTTVVAGIDDVASRAGVSISTVSRALRGLPGVSPRTRERVLSAAAALHYTASPHAAGLASGKTSAVAVVMPFVSRWFSGRLLLGIEPVLAASRYNLLLSRLGDPESRADFLERLPLRKRVDGVLAACLPLANGDVDILSEVGVPVVVVGASHDSVPSVYVDDVGGASAAVQHLINLGHRRIGLIGGRHDDPITCPTPLSRREGYRRCLADNGLDPDADLEEAGDFTVDGGGRAMAALLSRRHPPTAVFAESDEMAMGAVRAARAAGLRIPGDVSIVGFDGHDLAPLFDLTTVDQHVSEQGRVAATLLLEVIETRDGAAERAHVELPTQLVIRGSSARRAGAEPAPVEARAPARRSRRPKALSP